MFTDAKTAGIGGVVFARKVKRSTTVWWQCHRDSRWHCHDSVTTTRYLAMSLLPTNGAVYLDDTDHTTEALRLSSTAV